MSDLISRQAAIDALRTCYDTETISMDNGNEYINYGDAVGGIEQLSSALPDRKLIDDYMLKIVQNISPHTATEGVIAIKYYLEQIYEQIYGKGEKPKWMI